METWKDVKGYEGYYLVSDKGNMRSLHGQAKRDKKLGKMSTKGKPLKLLSTCGYSYIQLCKNSKIKARRVHRLVAESFIPNPDNKPCVNHKDGNKLNNIKENLEWCTVSENTRHAVSNGLMPKGEKSYLCKTKLSTVRYIKSSNKTARQLSKELGINLSRVSSIKNNHTWKHVKIA